MTHAYKPREAAPLVLRALRSMPVTVLTGMRQVGKTTFLRSQLELRDRRYVTLDDFARLQEARENPDEFLGNGEPVTIDEVQRCPELLLAVKRAVDRDRAPGRFLLSGSAHFSLLGGTVETLAGRAVSLNLAPFSRREIDGRTGTPPFLFSLFKHPAGGAAEPVRPADVLTGGLPPVCLGGTKDPRLWFHGYEQTYVERDLRALSQVADLVAFRHFLRLAALRTAQVLNQSDLARDAKLNAMTAQRYLSLLETSFLTVRVPAFRGSRASRLIKAPKLFVADSGLAAALCGVEALGADEPMRGALFETYVAQNLSSLLEARGPGARLHYWNVQGRHEVDFVVEVGGECVAIEVKAAAQWQDHDLRGLDAFVAATPRCRAAILAYNGTEVAHLKDRLWAVPLGVLLS